MAANIRAIVTAKGYAVTPVYNGTTVSNSGDLVAIVLSGIGIGENKTHKVDLSCSNGAKIALHDFYKMLSNPGYIYEVVARTYIYHNFTANSVTVSMSAGGSNGTAIAGYAIKRVK